MENQSGLNFPGKKLSKEIENIQKLYVKIIVLARLITIVQSGSFGKGLMPNIS